MMIKKMLLVVAISIIWMVLAMSLSFPVALIGIVASASIALYLNHLINHAEMLKRYEKMIEPIYVVANDKYSDKEFPSTKFDPWIIRSSYRNVMDEVNRQKALLVEANNQNYLDGQIDVYPIIFEDGEFVNESWKEYIKRTKSEISEIRAARHKLLKEKDNIFYLTHHHQQTRSFEFTKKS